MKNIALILLLIGYLCATSSVGELLKLPLLASHFVEHKQESQNLTFWQFLAMHYTETQVQDSDHDKDMKLPFKSCTNSAAHITLTVPPAPIILYAADKQPIFWRILAQQPLWADSFIRCEYANCVWQPPRFFS